MDNVLMCGQGGDNDVPKSPKIVDIIYGRPLKITDFPEALSYRRYLSWIEHASVGGVGARDRILHPLVGAHLGYFLTAVLVPIWAPPGQVPLNLGIGVEFVDFS